MAFAIYSTKPGKGGIAGVTHVFYGHDEEEAWDALEAHADICPKFGPAYQASETIESIVEIDEIPEFDEEALDDFFDLAGDVDEEEEET